MKRKKMAKRKKVTKREKVTVMLAGLALFLAACENEAPGKAGDKVAINFSVGGVAADAPRSVDLGEPETVVVDLDDKDYYYFSATLAADEEEVRAVTTSALVAGQPVHLEAYYTTSGALAGSADYHANAAGRLVLDDPDSPLEVDPAAGPYDFAAYSNYKSTASLSLTGIDPRTDDLIWGGVTNQPITATESGRTVAFNLKHKFSQVRVRVSVANITGAKILEIGDVTIETQKTVDLTLKDGSLVDNTELEPLDVTPTLAKIDDVNYRSDYYMFYPSPTKVTISSIKILVDAVEHTFSGLSADFVTALALGERSTLVVDLQSSRFAYSNIYWDGEKLTFDTTNKGHEGYQGLCFKWGSLVGISLAQPTAFSTSTPVYIPNYDSDTPTDSDWTKVTSHSYTAAKWIDPVLNVAENDVATIPYLDGSFQSGAYGTSNMYLMDAAQNTDEMYESYRGDICQYLSKTGAVTGNYRMPTSSEFGATGANWMKGITSWPNDNTALYVIGNDSGTADLIQGSMGWLKNTVLHVTLPASGWRHCTTGVLDHVGSHGSYWSGSAEGNIRSYCSQLNGNGMNPKINPQRSYALTVRCIKKLPTE
jgi:hypothetical protein